MATTLLTRKQYRKALAEIALDIREADAALAAVEALPMRLVKPEHVDAWNEANDTLSALFVEARNLRARYAHDCAARRDRRTKAGRRRARCAPWLHLSAAVSGALQHAGVN